MNNNFQEENHNQAVEEFYKAQRQINLPQTYGGNTTTLGANQRWEAAILQMVTGMELYATLHKRQHEVVIGNDSYFGPLFDDMINMLCGLFRGEMGRLDGRLMSEKLKKFAKENNLDWEI
jgi:hypothetical protein